MLLSFPNHTEDTYWILPRWSSGKLLLPSGWWRWNWDNEKQPVHSSIPLAVWFKATCTQRQKHWYKNEDRVFTLDWLDCLGKWTERVLKNRWMDVSIKGTKPRVCSHVCLWAFRLGLLWALIIEEGLWEGKGSNVKLVRGLDYWAVSISSAAVVWFTPCDSWACSCPIYVEEHHSCEAARSTGAKLIPHIRNQGCSAACLGLFPNLILLHCAQKEQSYGEQKRGADKHKCLPLLQIPFASFTHRFLQTIIF